MEVLFIIGLVLLTAFNAVCVLVVLGQRNNGYKELASHLKARNLELLKSLEPEKFRAIGRLKGSIQDYVVPLTDDVLKNKSAEINDDFKRIERLVNNYTKGK